MALEQGASTGIALNITRTRVTVLVFNLTIISLMLSIMAAARSTSADHTDIAHLTSSVALYIGFCLTLLGIYVLLASQNLDAQGLSRPLPFTLGSITTYLALSQTVTAFMHEYLLGFEVVLEAARPGESVHSLAGLGALGDTGLLVLFVMGAAVWILTTYVAPLHTGLKSPVPGGQRWIFAGYYLALQIPIYWVHAGAWRLQYVPADQPTNMLSIFALQFVQPLLWFR